MGGNWDENVPLGVKIWGARGSEGGARGEEGEGWFGGLRGWGDVNCFSMARKDDIFFNY